MGNAVLSLRPGCRIAARLCRLFPAGQTVLRAHRKPGRRTAALLMGALLCAALSGCARYPERADDGAAWERSWEMMGAAMGVEPPGGSLTLLENTVVLAADDTYYATWVSGEASPYVNADGAETELYPAQMYLLLYGCADGARAAAMVDDWLARERERYTVRDMRQETHNAQAYTVLVYDVASDGNPYERGASAFGVFGHYAVSAEYTCTAEDTSDAAAVLSGFLDGCHYSASALR